MLETLSMMPKVATTDSVTGGTWIAATVAGLYWLVESISDAFLFHLDTFWRRLLPADMNELWMRAVICALLIGFVFYAKKSSHLIRRLKRDQDVLHTRLAQIEKKTHTGFIKVCAWCKKVQDPAGSWEPMEAYIEEHTPAHCSHGICPRCFEQGVL